MPNVIDLLWTELPVRHTMAPQRLDIEAGDAVTLRYTARSAEPLASQVGRTLGFVLATAAQPMTPVATVANAGFSARTNPLTFSVVVPSVLTRGLPPGKYVWDLWDLTPGTEQPLSYGTADVAFAGPWTPAEMPAAPVVPLDRGGLGVALADPGADRILFWDDSAGEIAWLNASTGLTISGTNMTAAGGGGGSGDMTKAVYDTDDDGVVDAAETVPLAGVTGLASALALKAPLASPTLTGVPTAPTAVNATNTPQLATTAFVHAIITDVINAAPAALDTLKELADALGDDANFAATMTTALAGKAAVGHTHTLSAITDAGTAAALNVPASGNAAAGEVVKGSDTRLTDARTPTAHTHPLSALTQSGATTGQIPSWSGAAWVPVDAPSGGGGMAINGAITGGTAGRVLFVGPGGVLAQTAATVADGTYSRIASITVANGIITAIVTDPIPQLSSASVDATGTAFTLVFSEPVTGHAGFVLTASGGASSLTYAAGNGTDTFTFTLGRTIVADEVLTLAYVPGDAEDATGNALEAFSGFAVTNGSTQAYDPSQEVNLELWLEAARLTGRTNGQAVGAAGLEYTDFSSNSYHLEQATAGNRPVYSAAGGPGGTPTVLFDGANRWLARQFAAPLSQPNTIYLAVVLTGGTQSPFDGFSGSGRHQVYFDTVALSLYAGGGGYQAGWSPQPLPVRASLFEIVFDGASTRVYRFGIDGGAVAGSPGAQALDGVTLGMYIGGGGLPITGNIPGVLIFRGAHDAATRVRVRNYCMAHMGFAETKPQVVCHGDSLTAGYLLPDPATQAYPALLAAALGSGWDVTNDGTSGLRVNQLTAECSPRPGALYRPLRTKNIIAYQGGINDLYQGADAAAVLSRKAAYYTEAKRLGFNVVGHTITAASASYGGLPPGFEAERVSANSTIRAASAGVYWDALADVGADAILGSPTEAADTANNTYDGIHWRQAIYGSRWVPLTLAAVNTL